MMIKKKNNIILVKSIKNTSLFKYLLLLLFIATFFSNCNNVINLNNMHLIISFSAMIAFSNLNNYKIDDFRSFGNNKNLSRRLIIIIIIIISNILFNNVNGQTTNWDCKTSSNSNPNSGIYRKDENCTISGSDGHVVVTNTLEVIGSNVDMNNLITITAATNQRHFYLNDANATLILRYLKLVGGEISGNSGQNSYGGSILIYTNGGQAKLYFTILENNKATSGGGIYARGDRNGAIYIYNSIIRNNEATVDRGGGIRMYYSNYPGAGIIVNTTFSHNKAKSGGAMDIYDSRIMLKDCTISNNEASYKGGGLFVESAGNIIYFQDALSVDNNNRVAARIFCNSKGFRLATMADADAIDYSKCKAGIWEDYLGYRMVGTFTGCGTNTWNSWNDWDDYGGKSPYCYIDSLGSLNITRTVIRNNKVTTSDFIVNMNGGSDVYSYSMNGGGGVYLMNAVEITIRESMFALNNAYNDQGDALVAGIAEDDGGRDYSNQIPSIAIVNTYVDSLRNSIMFYSFSIKYYVVRIYAHSGTDGFLNLMEVEVSDTSGNDLILSEGKLGEMYSNAYASYCNDGATTSGSNCHSTATAGKNYVSFVFYTAKTSVKVTYHNRCDGQDHRIANGKIVIYEANHPDQKVEQFNIANPGACNSKSYTMVLPSRTTLGVNWNTCSSSPALCSEPPFTGVCENNVAQQPVFRCEAGWERSDSGKCYKYDAVERSWEDAKTYCNGIGGILASIHSAEENDFITQMLEQQSISGTYMSVWLGMNSATHNEWLDGTEFDYINWHEGEPSGDGSCTMIWIAADPSSVDYHGEWNDAGGNHVFPSLCMNDATAVSSGVTCSASCPSNHYYYPSGIHAGCSSAMLEWDCISARNKGTYRRSSDCTISGSNYVPVSGTLEIIGANTDMSNLITITAATNQRHFYVNGKNDKLILRYLKLIGGDVSRHSSAASNLSGGAILFVNGGVGMLFSVHIHDNSAAQGGAIAVENNSTLNIIDSNIRNNHAIDGGAFWITASSTLYVNDTIVELNSGINFGGSISCMDSMCFLNSSTIQKNNIAHERYKDETLKYNESLTLTSPLLQYGYLNPTGIVGNTFNEYSVSMWVKVDAFSSDCNAIFSLASDINENNLLMLIRPNGKLEIIIAGPGIQSSSPTFSDNGWHHVCASYKKNSANTFAAIDGIIEITMSASSDISNSPSTSKIILGEEQDIVGGNFDSTQSHIGRISDVTIYNRKLSLSECQQAKDAKYLSEFPSNPLYTWNNFKTIGLEMPAIFPSQELKKDSSDATTHYGYLSPTGIRGDTFSEYAVSMWVKIDSYSSEINTIFSLASSISTNNFLLTINNEGKIKIDLSSTQARSTFATFTDNIAHSSRRWHHVCASYKKYDPYSFVAVDGILEITFSASLDISNVPKTSIIILGEEQDSLGGSFSSAQSHIGRTSDVTIYNRKLSLNECQQAKDARYMSEFPMNPLYTWNEFYTTRNGMLRDSSRWDTEAKAGGNGIFVHGGSVNLHSTLILDNYNNIGHGGGISINYATANISNCTINYNQAVQGGGIYAYESSLLVSNSEISNNNASIDNEWYLLPPKVSGTKSVYSSTTSSNTCVEATIDACESAVALLLAEAYPKNANYEGNNIRNMQVGSGGTCNDNSWGNVPLGCSAQMSWTAHFKTGGVNCGHEMYQVVCREAEQRGGGISLLFSEAALETLVISNNQARNQGGGVFVNSPGQIKYFLEALAVNNNNREAARNFCVSKGYRLATKADADAINYFECQAGIWEDYLGWRMVGVVSGCGSDGWNGWNSEFNNYGGRSPYCYVAPSSISITNTVVRNNKIQSSSNAGINGGGGLYLQDSQKIDIRESSFISNIANNNRGDEICILTTEAHMAMSEKKAIVNTHFNNPTSSNTFDSLLEKQYVVRVYAAANLALNLEEVEVLDNRGHRIKLTDGTLGEQYNSHVAAYCNDGIIDASDSTSNDPMHWNFCHSDTTEGKNYVSFAFITSANEVQVKYYNRCDCCNDRIANGKIVIYDANNEDNKVEQLNIVNPGLCKSQSYTLTLPGKAISSVKSCSSEVCTQSPFTGTCTAVNNIDEDSMENGFCVTEDGGDQNAGVIKLNSLDINTADRRKNCLYLCKATSGYTGCEGIWNEANRGCYVHTDAVSHGNNAANHVCWIRKHSNVINHNMDLGVICNYMTCPANTYRKQVTASSLPPASDAICQSCPNGKYTRTRNGIEPIEFRDQIIDCIAPPKILSMSPNMSSISGDVITTIIGENFGIDNNSHIVFSVINPNTNEEFTWKDIVYISSSQIQVTSIFGNGQNLLVRMSVDGISSILLNTADQFKFSYLDPKIVSFVSPPFQGGTLQIIGESFAKQAESKTEVAIVDNNCEVPCTDMRAISGTVIHCQYVGFGQPNTCTNKSIVVRTNFGNSIRESNRVELCYDVDRGELENVPELDQTVVETDGFVRYGISLSDAVVPNQNVQVRIRSVSYDALMNKIDEKNGYRCIPSPKLITINNLNHNETHTITINTEDNKVDEGTLETIAYKCEIVHSIESLDKQYNQSADKVLRINILNDDRADFKLQLQDENNPATFDEEKVKTVGPMCMVEASNLTYGITLSTRPTKQVAIYHQLQYKYIDSPLQFEFTPTLPIVFQPYEWNSTKSFTISVKHDVVDNHQDIDAIVVRHWVVTEDPVFQTNALNASAKFRITDDDTAGIQLAPDSVSIVVNGGVTRIITIMPLLSKPMDSVTLKIINVDNIESVSVVPDSVVVTPEQYQQETKFTMKILDDITKDIAFQMRVEPTSLDYKYNGASSSKLISVLIPPDPLLPPVAPKNVIIKRINTSYMRVSWDQVVDNFADTEGSSYDLVYNMKYGVTKPLDNSTGTFYRVVNSINATTYDCILRTPLYKKPLYKKVMYVMVQAKRVKQNALNEAPTYSDWSIITPDWKIASECVFDAEYLNTTCDYPLGQNGDSCEPWACKVCPEGASCKGQRNWKDVKAKFGYWRHEADMAKRSEFTKCLFPPACQGDSNVMFKDQFANSTGFDPASIDRPEGCAYDIGYSIKCLGDGAPRCRLCSTCAIGYKRKIQDGMARCSKCPVKTANVFLLIGGIIVVIVLLVMFIKSHLESGGKRTTADMYKIIIINYLQLSSLTAGMDVPWPNVLGFVFEIQGVISTIGEHLLSPDCELQGMRASDLIYAKQIGYLLLPWILASLSYIGWRIISYKQGRIFTFRGFDDRSPSLLDGCVATIVFLLYLMYPSLCRSAFALIMCITVDGKSYLLADLQEPCFEGRHLMWFLCSTIPQILLYVIGLPLFGFFTIRKYAKNQRLQHQITQFRYGMLYSGYRVERWWWDLIVAFRKASVALITSWLVGEFEVHTTIGMLTFVMILNVWGNPYTDLAIKDNTDKNVSRGQKLLLLDTSANFIIFVTAWSGLFFIIYPHCEHHTGWCIAMVGIVAFVNALFLIFCLVIFLNEKYKEGRFEYIDHLRNLKKKMPCLRVCIRVDDKPGYNEARLRIKYEKEKEIQQRSRSQSNPLKYRKSFVKEKSVVNPMMDFALDTNANGDIEMVGNPMGNNNNRKKQYRRKRGRTMSIIDNLKDETSQQNIRFNNVLSRSKRLKELAIKVRKAKDMKKQKMMKKKGEDVEIVESGSVEKFEIHMGKGGRQEAIGRGWHKVVVTNSQKVLYFNEYTGSMTDKHPFGLLEGWIMMFDEGTGQFYYYHGGSGETKWKRPMNVNR